MDLSDAALDLLKLHAERCGEIQLDHSNREAYRELARAGFMVVGHSFAGGRESFYALTELGSRLARVLRRDAFTYPLPSKSALPHH